MREQARYAWPASKLTERDMFLVWRARETAPRKTTISTLVADAVRQVYGHLADVQFSIDPQEELKEAA